ncbi:uncharacterized protein [Dysidea avara]|uniref:uncharacterized protein isoform X1 n=2 Tax=Dysidea avara TaxID=196820 RepID=UPI00332CF3D5
MVSSDLFLRRFTTVVSLEMTYLLQLDNIIRGLSFLLFVISSNGANTDKTTVIGDSTLRRHIPLTHCWMSAKLNLEVTRSESELFKLYQNLKQIASSDSDNEFLETLEEATGWESVNATEKTEQLSATLADAQKLTETWQKYIHSESLTVMASVQEEYKISENTANKKLAKTHEKSKVALQWLRQIDVVKYSSLPKYAFAKIFLYPRFEKYLESTLDHSESAEHCIKARRNLYPD